jgi:hypothetical protein
MSFEEQIDDIQVIHPPMKLLTNQDQKIRIVTASIEAVDSSVPSSESSPRSTETIGKLTIPFGHSKPILGYCSRFTVAVLDICVAAWQIVLAKDAHIDRPCSEYVMSINETNIDDESSTSGAAVPRVCEVQIHGSDSALSLVQQVNVDRHDPGREPLSHNDSRMSSQLITSLLTFSQSSTAGSIEDFNIQASLTLC